MSFNVYLLHRNEFNVILVNSQISTNQMHTVHRLTSADKVFA